MKLKSVDLTVSLESLSFYLARGEGDDGDVGHVLVSHVDRRGRVKMVDVGDKPITAREAIARGSHPMSREALAPDSPRRR